MKFPVSSTWFLGIDTTNFNSRRLTADYVPYLHWYTYTLTSFKISPIFNQLFDLVKMITFILFFHIFFIQWFFTFIRCCSYCYRSSVVKHILPSHWNLKSLLQPWIFYIPPIQSLGLIFGAVSQSRLTTNHVTTLLTNLLPSSKKTSRVIKWRQIVTTE